MANFVHSVYAIVRRPIPVEVETWWVECCHCWRGQQVDRRGSLQDMSTGPRPHMVSQWYAWTAIVILALLFSKSLATRCFHSVVRPLPKKAELDDSHLKNYRPVSSIRGMSTLPFLSRLLERVVQNQLLRFDATLTVSTPSVLQHKLLW